MHTSGQDELGYAGYGAMPGTDKGVLLQGPRRRMNFLPMVLCVLFPWALFVLVYGIMGFSMHYSQPLLSDVLVFTLLFVVVCIGFRSLSGRLKWLGGRTMDAEPSWMIFFAATLLLAWALGFAQGSASFSANTRRYYDLRNLNNYTNVYPNRVVAQQLMDAGVVSFAPGTQLDVTRSMAFKNKVTYCVAPIVFGTEAPVSYDFWAVGTDCCSGSQADFHCRNYNNPQASGGIRVMDSADRPFYRLAVQQAESTYNIKAAHPIFFHWEVEPSQQVNAWLSEGKSEFVAWTMSYLALQIFLVVVAAVVFSKIGQL